eukprot:6188510-Pleurochrysis_carterae.AAC.1
MHRNTRYWRYIYDPTLTEQSFVHVSCNTALTDRATDSLQNSNLFCQLQRQVVRDRAIQVAFSSCSGCRRKYIEKTDCEDAGWNRKKVKADVLTVAKLEKFSALKYLNALTPTMLLQVTECNALFDFHEDYQTADSLPLMPIALITSDERSLPMRGMPIAWGELWSKLAGRFPGPHHQNTNKPASAGTQSDSGADAVRRNTGAAAASMPPPPLSNSVTALNYLPAARQREVAAKQHYAYPRGCNAGIPSNGADGFRSAAFHRHPGI